MMKQVLKRTYGAIPFKRQIFSVVRWIGVPPKSIYQHLHFNGDFQVKLPGKKFFRMRHYGSIIENQLFWEGIDAAWEKESMRVWMRLCAEARTILDIGANTGLYALVAQATNPQAAVYAFEPHPDIFALLQENIRLNEFPIVAEQTAATDKDGPIVLEYFTGKTKTLSVEGIRLSQYITQHSLTDIDLIKIDVEQHEPHVLSGLGEYLSSQRPSLLIEILTDAVAREVEQLVQGCGYRYYNIDERGGIRRTHRIEKSDYYNYLLCSPQTADRLSLA